MVEHVQVTRSDRWTAAAASVYCLAAGLIISTADPSFRVLGWSLGATFLAITAIPQLFRRRTAFLAACWTSIALILACGIFGLQFGACLFLPAALPLILAAALPATPNPPVPDKRSRPERRRAAAKRLACGAAIAGLLILMAAITV